MVKFVNKQFIDRALMKLICHPMSDRAENPYFNNRPAIDKFWGDTSSRRRRSIFRIIILLKGLLVVVIDPN